MEIADVVQCNFDSDMICQSYSKLEFDDQQQLLNLFRGVNPRVGFKIGLSGEKINLGDFVSLSYLSHALGVPVDDLGKAAYASSLFNLYGYGSKNNSNYQESVQGIAALYLLGMFTLREGDDCAVREYVNKWNDVLGKLRYKLRINRSSFIRPVSSFLRNKDGVATLHVYAASPSFLSDRCFDLLRFVPKVAALDDYLEGEEAEEPKKLEEGLETEVWRPLKSSQCTEYRDCCPFWSCRHNPSMDLVSEVNDKGIIHQEIILYNADDPNWQQHCQCTISQNGEGLPLESVGRNFGLTRERVRQEEEIILAKLAEKVGIELYERLPDWIYRPGDPLY